MFNTIILGSDVGKAKGTLRSNPGEGQHLECPCKVNLYITNIWKIPLFFASTFWKLPQVATATEKPILKLFHKLIFFYFIPAPWLLHKNKKAPYWLHRASLVCERILKIGVFLWWSKKKFLCVCHTQEGIFECTAAALEDTNFDLFFTEQY